MVSQQIREELDINPPQSGFTIEDVAIERSELDQLQQAYTEAVDRWIVTIREEEALATPDHSIVAWEHWEQAGFKAQEAEEEATAAKEAYKAGLRLLDYHI